ncbi:putative transcription regulator Homeodomain-LIKE family [Rosa chinensis]|uniref:Putative transcription regulator Homeodomain-LIKE family n=1 Tax=Rosa chinensis TaxID=74649 RepID=A0A2P6PJ74_ROSCH|nr:putative transcription regulator Homeodomain-LIKE family [Rosa chinensis]
MYGGGRRGSMGLSSELKAELCCNGLMSADKHEFQSKIANLITLLEEVEDRCENGCAGAAKSYTALALKAMSRHFGSLRDAIMSYISRKAKVDARFSESETVLDRRECPFNSLGLSMAKGKQLGDQLEGCMRTWLFKHFLHPYPYDSEKLMLASQTGLSKNQEMYKEEFADSSQDSNPVASSSVTGENDTDHTDD